ncbi:EpsG family protein [Thalassotalea ponticola]|uniref:EpsG family protein n=1 Tax=Thalassotalea ponticola TaxID=1523392 RepID=UPI0025B616B2|nr:EpsG family protein [Thalassotalea ponticola]MDN3652654.1 EpsG family protein [Thalassotalea ponticola]
MSLKSVRIVGACFVLFFMIYIGFRPLSGRYFVDMITYAHLFETVENGGDIASIEPAFFAYMKFLSSFTSLDGFFFITCFIYTFCVFLACRRFFDKSWAVPFFFIVLSAFFFSYATNGMRNGLATSIFLLGLSQKRWGKWGLILLSITIHSSLALPATATLFFKFYKRVPSYLFGWLFCLLVSAAIPSIGPWLSSLGVFNDKFNDYALASSYSEASGKIGFRVDFLAFSILPILLAYYFIFKRRFYDPLYNEIVCIYLTANAFWLLVIRVPFSNRFAYLSWFLYGLVISYPLVKRVFIKRQNQVVALLLITLFLFHFTFLY